ncbi:carbon storage regulator CsrA [Paenibacillus sp. J5C_2022]|uniref:carbon storage regulator CsrA n=1 Tax=Paenibacillus sp. J5C2022 TaxID=2977129 RepID=UPI0021D17618|nr:carbon storage regulator CsrA [Paenibacillus sp. J5C2022]MCU6708440.1 carbon storage regulator CsrA [Paenibacillus sp. J5C2022]
MLVLSRKSNESIMIGPNIEVVVIGMEGDNVKLGIRAPKDVQIYRQEVYKTIQEENRAAAQGVRSIEDLSQLFNK